MDQGKQYGQANMNLPHDVVPLPSQGIFYTNKKKSLKVGYLTAQDENLLLSNSGYRVVNIDFFGLNFFINNSDFSKLKCDG